jgi:hypothetical protein
MTRVFEPRGMKLDEVAVACVESGSSGLLLDVDDLPTEFFDLSTRAAGHLLHDLGKYGIRLAAVVPNPEDYSGAFQSFVRESNRGRSVRFFTARAEAKAWLQSDGDDRSSGGSHSA